MRRPTRKPFLIASSLLVAVSMFASSGTAATTDIWQGLERSAEAAARAPIPEDRYAMAGGCYAIRPDGAEEYLARVTGGYAAIAVSLDGAEPFTFQATDLGSYLLFDSKQMFLAASEGAVADAVYAATRSTPGAIVGGVTIEQTDAAADTIARSEVNRQAGRGERVVAAAAPSELADWTIVGDGPFSLTLAATDQALGVSGSGPILVGENAPGSFTFELTDGCAAYPEIEVNVDGPILGGANSFQEVRGYMDLHLHMMAFEFLGGRARCGRPWHRYGVAYALVDCPDHLANGATAVLEQVLSGPGLHDPSGWPSFLGWPRYNSLTHEQVYYKWLERAWRGGLRLFTNLLVDNNQLCKIYPFKRNSCNEMDGVRLQAQRIRELERYIDAQSGGPGEGWFRIVTDPFQARDVISQGKLAVVLGIEVSVPLDCGITLRMPHCDAGQVDARLAEVYDLGVRQMELTNKFDNALSGVTGDGGTTGIVVNQGNLGETGQYWQMETCADGEPHDKQQMNVHDDTNVPDELVDRDALVGAILAAFGTSGAAPVYPQGPHCNVQALSELGRHMIRGMVERGMIFDPDHMSARARTQAMDLVRELGHSGVVSSHGWADDTIYERIYELGGVVTPNGDGVSGFIDDWRQHREWKDDRFTFGFGYGADTNGFSGQGGPRGANAENKLIYPFTGFGGTTIHQQKSGTRTYDLNLDGTAHYGLYPDWFQDLRNVGGNDIIEDMERGPEAYLQMWERSIGISGDACRSDIDDLTEAQVSAVAPGLSPRQVLDALGQPSSRLGSTFTFCVTGDQTAVVTFGPNETVSSVAIS